MLKWFSLLALTLSFQPALGSEKLERAMQVLVAIEVDQAKLNSFCLIKRGFGAGAEVSFDDMHLDDYYANVGSEFDELPERREELSPEDAQSLDDALDHLVTKCTAEVVALTSQQELGSPIAAAVPLQSY